MTCSFLEGPVGYIALKGRDGHVRGWAIVDAADFHELDAKVWHLTDSGYAARWYNGRPPRRKRERMHRRILGLEHDDKRQGDHINRNRLDNRRSNLRVVDNDAQSRQNQSAHRDSSSKLRGVSFDTERGLWLAQVSVDGKRVLYKRFPFEAEAGEAARAARAEYMPHAID